MPNVEEFVAICRSYLGTPFRHQGRLPHSGLDCVGVVIAAATELGVEVSDSTAYKMRPNAAFFLMKMREHCQEIPMSDAGIGDLMIFEYDGNPQHVAVLSGVDPFMVIHARLDLKQVVEHTLDETLLKKVTHIFRINGLDR